MAAADYYDDVQKVYVAYYGRPADREGLLYWAGRLDAANGDLSEIINAFGTSAEAETLFGGQTYEEMVSTIYMQLFNRLPDPEGLDFYVQGLLTGKFTLASVMLDVLNGAKNADVTIIEAKLAAANAFTDTFFDGVADVEQVLDYAGDANAALARAWLAGVTDADSAAAAEETIGDLLAEMGGNIVATYTLTTGVDTVTIPNANTQDIVKGVLTDSDEGGTLNTADSITGNGKTIVQLTVAANDGTADSGVFEIDNVAEINIKALTNADIQGAGLSNVGSINVTSGIDGNWVFIDNLELGTDLTISGVTGSISASYDAGSGVTQIYVDAYNGDVADTASASVDADHNAVLDSGNDGYLEVYSWGSNVVIGDVTMTAGDSAGLDVTAGDTSGASGSIGNISLTAGDDSNADVYLWDVAAGDVAVTLGNTADVTVEAQGEDDVSIGDVTVTVGDSSSVDVLLGEDIADSVTAGDITVVAGATADVNIDVGTNGAISGDVTVGDVSVSMADGWLGMNVDSTADIVVGNVAVTGADSADILINGVSGTTTDSVTVGNISVALNADSGEGDASVTVSNTDSVVGDLTVGDVAISVNTGEAYFYAFNEGTGSTTDGMSTGTLTVGDVTLSAGSELDLSTTVEATVTVSNDAWTGSIGGDVVIGDVTITVGDGYVSGTQTNEAVANAWLYNWGEDGVGSITVGDVSLTGGDFASLSASVEAWIASDGDVGNVTVGNVSYDAGESAYVYWGVYQGSNGSGTLGDLAVGNVDVAVAQDSLVQITITQSISDSSTSNNIGNLTVGDVSVIGGDNSTVSISIDQTASFGDTGTGNSIGDLVVGDISVALSATTDVALAGGSSINVNISKSNWNADLVAGGDFTVGDIDLSVGNTGDIELNVENSGSFLQMGDTVIGDVTLAAGDDSSVDAYFLVANYTTGDLGNISLGNVDVTIGDNSTGEITVSIDSSYTGNIGDILIGDVSLVAGDSSDLRFSVTISKDSTTGDLASFTLGDVTMTGGDSTYLQAYVDFNLFTEESNIGDITVGDVTVTLGESSTADFTITASITETGNFDHIGIGSIAADVGYASDFNFTAYFYGTSDINGADVGDISLNVAEAGTAYVTVTVDASNDAGDMTVGDIALSLADTNTATTDTDAAFARVDINLTSTNTGDTLTVGDISVDVAGDLDADEAWLFISNSSGDVVIGDITVTGTGVFNLDGSAWTTATTDNVSFLSVSAGGDITLGNIDFSGYANDAIIDASFSTFGAASIIGSDGDDVITGNADDNVITGGTGQDDIDLTDGGDDTVVTSNGDTGNGTDAAEVDVITGFDVATDLLDFNLVAGAASNVVIETGNLGDDDYAAFRAAANDALNSTVKYYIQDDGTDTFIAVNFGSGDCDLVIKLAGVADASTLTFENIIA